MTAIAFHGDPAIKAQALDRLRRHIAAGSFVYFPAWDEGKANVIGAVIETDDTPGYAERLGYPIALVEALPMMVNAFRPLHEAARFAEAWLARTPVGADLSRVTSRLIVTILERPDIAAMLAPHDEAARCRDAVIALHRRAITGDEPDRKAWKAARLAAVSASDTLTDTPMAHKAAMVAEAAAWPGTMRTVLRDTQNASGRLSLDQRMQAIGWTEADEARVFHIRDQAEKDGRMADLVGLERVYGLLDADHADLARHFRQRVDQMEKSAEDYRTMGWETLDLFEQAPVAVVMA